MKQGEIWYADLNPTTGSEQRGGRPVVIVSGNLLNDNTKIVIVCPITSKLKHYYGNVILVPDEINGLKKESEILTFHIRSVSKIRLKQRIGVIQEDELVKIKNTLSDILRY